MQRPPLHSDPYEVVRARELDTVLGPKGSDRSVDFICDLHNTTSNMGSCLITAPDYLSMHAARYVQSVSTDPCRVISIKPEIPSFSLMSIAKHYITLEIDPQPTGLIRSDIYNMMRCLVGHVLDFIELFNQGLSLPYSPRQCFELQQPFDYPRDEEGVLTACIHPERQAKFEIGPGTSSTAAYCRYRCTKELMSCKGLCLVSPTVPYSIATQQ
ncbi:UNVERIFIED_CONTAM: hypothetical protein FKN15_075012 [Acipenser sinensis]